MFFLLFGLLFVCASVSFRRLCVRWSLLYGGCIRLGKFLGATVSVSYQVKLSQSRVKKSRNVGRKMFECLIRSASSIQKVVNISGADTFWSYR